MLKILLLQIIVVFSILDAGHQQLSTCLALAVAFIGIVPLGPTSVTCDMGLVLPWAPLPVGVVD